jgi:transcriptional regulator with XRE-family HTH domain
MAVHDRIRAFRKKHNLSQHGMSKIVGVGSATISRWENGQDTPSDNYRARLEVAMANYKPGSNGVTSESSNGTSSDELALAYGKAVLAQKHAKTDFDAKLVSYAVAYEAFTTAETARDLAENVLETAEDTLSDLEARLSSLTK